MSRDSNSTYRDELAAAQARVAVLEEKLTERERATEDPPEAEAEGAEADDLVMAQLLEQRRTLEAQGRQLTFWVLTALWAAPGLVGLLAIGVNLT
jgi:hypothetical protein